MHGSRRVHSFARAVVRTSRGQSPDGDATDNDESEQSE